MLSSPLEPMCTGLPHALLCGMRCTAKAYHKEGSCHHINSNITLIHSRTASWSVTERGRSDRPMQQPLRSLNCLLKLFGEGLTTESSFSATREAASPNQ